MRQFCSAFPALELTVASSGTDGLRFAKHARPDLVLLDMNLPHMTGLQVLRALRADIATARMPIVALSADALVNHVQAAREAGFDDYWTKPIDFAAMERGLAQWLSGR